MTTHQDLPLNDLLLFIALAEQQSYSKAAKKIHMDVSALSKRIIKLEKQLGVQLLQRTTRQMSLTDAGKLLYQYATQMQQSLDHFITDLNIMQQAAVGKLRVKAPFGLGRTYLTTTISEFLKRYPDIHVELILGDQSPNLIQEEVDVLVTIKPLKDIDLIAKVIGQRNTGIYAAPSYLEKFGTPKKPQDLMQHNCLLHLDRSEKDLWRFKVKNKELTIPVKGAFQVNSSEALLTAAENGLGLTKLPSFIVSDSLQQGKLIAVLPNYCFEPTPIYAVYARHRSLPPKIKLFVNFLVEKLADLPLA